MTETELPETPAATDDAEGGAEVQHLNMIVGLATKQPTLALAALVALALSSGTLGSLFVAPLLDEALAGHEANDRAHNVDRIEQRLDRLEAKIDDSAEDLADVKLNMAAAVRLLEAR